MNAEHYTLGIDIGSTTVKIAILNDAHNIIFSDYKRHFANIRETLSDLLKEAFDKLGNINIHPMITGSLCSGGQFRCHCIKGACPQNRCCY